MRNAYDKWLAGEGCCNANNFIHIESADCKKEDVCECERILLEISNLHTDDLVLQEQIDELSGDVANKLDSSAYTPVDLSDYYTKEQVDELIPSVPSLSGYATEQWVLDKHYITGVDLSDYATKEEIPSLSGYATEQWVENKGYLTEHQPLKTINGQVISGTGNIEIEASGGSVTVDSALSFISTNPVENKVITEALNDKLDASAYTPTDLTNYVTISELNQYITNLQQQINSLIAAVSGCCGSQSGETQYRWVTMIGENDYWCSGTTKMSKEKEQSSTDGINWTDTGNIRSGSTVLEENCIECGYSPVTGDNKYVATTTGGTTISGACCEPDEYDPITCDELDLHEIAANTGQLRTINVGPCTKVIGNGLLTGEYNLTDVVIPSSVTAIKNTLLEGCTAMQTLTINRETPPAFHQTTGSGGVGLFSAYPDAETIPTGFKIYVPASAVNTYKTTTIWSRYANYIFAI